MNKTILILIFALLLTSSAYAITGSIGNARMIVTADRGESIERSVLVKNVNDVPLNISITVSGDLEKNVELDDKSFVLNANEDKKVYFTIYSDKDGMYTTKINVQFTPSSGNGVGLSSTIILKVGTGTGNDANPDNPVNDSSNNSNPNNTNNPSPKAFDYRILLIASPVVLIIALIVLIFAVKLKQKKSSRR